MQGRYGLTHTALMLGTYMIMRLKYSLAKVCLCLMGLRMEEYRTDSSVSISIVSWTVYEV